ncbi:hypothetical protein AgCh_009926 [Apium graveolens]
MLAAVVRRLRDSDSAMRLAFVAAAAAEALLKLAVKEKCSLFEYKSSCLVSLERRRFDKVKVVRDTMNQALEMWKTIIDEEDLWRHNCL